MMPRQRSPKENSYIKHWSILIFALALLGAQMSYNLNHTRQLIEKEAKNRLTNHSLVLIEAMDRRLHLINTVLLHLRDNVFNKLSSKTTTEELNRDMLHQVNTHDGVRTLLVFDSHGKVVASSRPKLIGRNFAHREYFQSLKQNPKPDRLHMSTPFTTVLDVYTLNLVRPIYNTDGEFAGLVSATIDANGMQALMHSMHASKDTRLAVIHGGGTLLMVVPELANSETGANKFNPQTTQQRHEQKDSIFQRHIKSGKAATVSIGMAAATDTESIVSMRTLQPADIQIDAALVIAAARDVSNILAPWREQFKNRLALFLLVMLISIFVLWIYQKKSKQAQQSLINLFAAIPDGILMLDKSGVVTYSNESARHMLGIKALQGERPILPQIQHGLAEEIEIIDKHGGKGWAEMRSAPLSWADESAVAISLRDITDRHLMEEQLVLAGKVLESTQEGIFVTRPDSVIISVNHAFTFITGYTADEAIGNTTRMLQSGQHDDAFYEVMWSAINTGGFWQGEIINRRKDGSLYPEWLSITSIQNSSGELTHLVGVFTDQTKHNAAEEALRSSEVKLRNITSAVSDAIIMIDDDGLVEFWNPSAAQMFGYSADEARNRGLHKMIIPERYRDMHVRALESFRLTGEGGAVGNTLEVPALHKDGHEFSIEFSLSALKLNNKWHAVGILRDITQRKQAELALKENEEKFRSICESSNDAIILMSKTGFLDCNARTLQLFDFQSKDDLTNKNLGHISPLLQPDGRTSGTASDEYVASAFELGSRRYEWVHSRRDGETFTADVLLSAYVFKGEQALQATVRDISEQKRAEKELEEKSYFLGERVKELYCLNNVTIRIQKGGSINQVVQDLVSFLPMGWRFPEICCASISWDGATFFSANFKETKWGLESSIVVENSTIGYVKVFYTKQMPQSDVGPFLQEEKQLIENISHHIAQFIHRKQAESALMESELSLSEAQRIASIGNWELDIVNNRLFWSDEIFRIFEIDKSQFDASYEAFLEAIYPDDRAAVNEAYMDSLKTRQPYNITHRLCMPDGRLKYVHQQCETAFNDKGEPVRSVGIIQDITERKIAEDRLNKFSLAVEQSPESIVITNLNAEIEYVNSAFEQTSGYSRDEVLGQNPNILQSGDTPVNTYSSLWDSLTSEQVWKGEFYNKRKDGTRYTEFATISPIRQADKSVTHFLAIKEDITEKKLIGQELDRHREHLQELVEEKTAELEVAKFSAESANRAKSEFLATMSHEIRTPMNAIIGMTYLLKKDILTRDQSDRLEKIDGAAAHLLTIINDILDLSKIEAGKLVLEESDFSLSALLDQIKSMLVSTASAKSIQIFTNSKSVPDSLRGDQTRLRQALLNFAGNAVKFTEQGSVSLQVTLQETDIDKVVVKFEVKDTGIGIAADQLPHLFQAFQQADSSTTRKFGGTGLGLAITQRLSALMGGETGVESTLGVGSTFWFTAQLKKATGSVLSLPDDDYLSAKAQFRSQSIQADILLVEDNNINQEIAVELLNRIGLKVDTAENGQQAVEMVVAKHYDLILMDVQMPVMDGLAATQVIRNIKGRESLPILAMTANAFAEDRDACLAAGMNGFVAKPVNPDDLYATIFDYLAEKQSDNRVIGTTLVARDDKSVEILREKLIDIDSPQLEGAIHLLNGDSERYVHLLHDLIARYNLNFADIQSSLDAGQFEDVGSMTHSLKGAAGSLGLVKLQRAATDLDIALRQQNETDNDLPQLLLALEKALTTVRNAVSRLKLNQSSNDDGPKIKEDIIRVLSDVESLLVIDDTTMYGLHHPN